MLKGFFFSAEEFAANKKPVNILAAQDGFYEIRENTIGAFCVKAPVVPELPVIREGFQMRLPKIPYHILDSILAFSDLTSGKRTTRSWPRFFGQSNLSIISSKSRPNVLTAHSWT